METYGELNVLPTGGLQARSLFTVALTMLIMLSLLPRAQAQVSIENQLKHRSPDPTIVDFSNYGHLLDLAAENHINGMAVTGDSYVVVNYPWYHRDKGDLMWWRADAGWKSYTFEMINKEPTWNRWPSGMQAVGDLLAVADNKYIRFFRLGADGCEEVGLPLSKPSGLVDFEFPTAANREVLGMARDPEKHSVYVVTTNGIFRTPAGHDSYLLPGTHTPDPEFRFRPIKNERGNNLSVPFGEAGLALLYDEVAKTFVCLSLGTNDQSYRFKACKIDLDSTGEDATVSAPFYTGDLIAHIGDAFGSGPSFRWGGTALIASDGCLEVYAAPKRLDNPFLNSSKGARWYFGGANYAVTVYTGDKPGAGTDANIFLTITGTRGNTGMMELNPLISGNAFERNQTDHCTLKGVKDVGEIRSITVFSDNAHPFAAWYLGYIEVTPDGRSPTRFTFNEWIETGHLIVTKSR